MKVLFVYGGNVKSMPFIIEQKKSLVSRGFLIEDYIIYGKGSIGYIKNLIPLINKIKSGGFVLVHAHYGLSGMLAVLQRLVPVIVTYHGSDVNLKKNIIFSFLASRLSSFNIYVNKDMPDKLRTFNKYEIIPCGVDFNIFYPVDKLTAKKSLELDVNRRYVLFTSSFDNYVKNYPLAKAAMEKIKEDFDVELIELKNMSRSEVNLYLNACDLLLMTSFSEGSPQIVKEALATNLPIVSTDVGDVKRLINGVSSCFIVNYDASQIAKKMSDILSSSIRTNGRCLTKDYDLELIAEKIDSVYRNNV